MVEGIGYGRLAIDCEYCATHPGHMDILRYDFIPPVLSYTHIDKWMKTTDEDAFTIAREVIRKEGLLVGGSSGSAVAGALKCLKSEEGWERFGNVPGQNVVIILADG